MSLFFVFTEPCAPPSPAAPPVAAPTTEPIKSPPTAASTPQPATLPATAASEVVPTRGARDEVVVVSAPTQDDGDRMEEAAGTTRFADDRSDSGVSSLRSCSGDERSGSRSSALSSSDEPPPQQPTQPVRVWRDPSLAAEPRVRHVHSVQHHTLLMSHQQPSTAPQPPASSAPPGVSATMAHYQPPRAAMHPHPMHLPPPGLYSQMTDMMWNKFPPMALPPHMMGSEELMQERDRMIR